MDRFAALDQLKKKWTDKFVNVKPDCPELERFANHVGRVVTVNYNGKALIDFADGAWYDVTASDEYLTEVDPEEAKGKFNDKMNSAQPFPSKQ